MPQGLTLADFYSPTCGPCKMLAFVLQDVDKSTDIQILKVNYDEESRPARRAQCDRLSHADPV